MSVVFIMEIKRVLVVINVKERSDTMRLNVIVTEGDIKNFRKVEKDKGCIYKTKASIIKALRDHLEMSSYTELSALDDDAERIEGK